MENVNTIDECRSKIVRNRVFDCHLLPAMEYTVSSYFDLPLAIVKSIFDCPLSDERYQI